MSSPELVAAARGPDQPRDEVLLDMNYRRGEDTSEEGLRALARLRRDDPDLAVVCMTAYGDIELAVEVMRRGATDFLTKPCGERKALGHGERSRGAHPRQAPARSRPGGWRASSRGARLGRPSPK